MIRWTAMPVSADSRHLEGEIGDDRPSLRVAVSVIVRNRDGAVFRQFTMFGTVGDRKFAVSSQIPPFSDDACKRLATAVLEGSSLHDAIIAMQQAGEVTV